MKQALVLAPDETGRTHSVDTHSFLEWVSALPRDDGLACDTETSSLAWGADVRLVQFGTSSGGYAVDVRDVAGQTLVKSALDAYSGPLVFHNSAFDIHRLDQIGVDPEFIWPRALDTHVMAHIINPDRISFKLKQLARVELGDQSTEEQKLLNKAMAKHGWDYSTVPLLVITPYGVMDTVLTHKLFTLFSSQMTEADWDVMRREMEVRWAMGTVQWQGMRLDKTYALDLHAKFVDHQADDEAWFKQFLLEDIRCTRCKGTGKTPKGTRDCGLCEGQRWLRNRHLDNPNANEQIASALKRQGWTPTVFTEKALTAKLDKKILKPLRDEYPLVDRLLEYKRIGKWDAAYVTNCLAEVDDADRVHAAYNTLGAKTGRMSCSNPPLQQLPKGGGGEIRRLFIASPGNLIASCDYSAIEPRLAGSLSGEPVIIKAYEDEVDLYVQFGEELGITRPEAKIFLLATLYGATAKRHAEVFGWKLNDAYRIVRAFWDMFPRLKWWNDDLIGRARSGDPIISGWGRTLRPHAPYAAPNAVIQGTAAEVMKDGLMRLWSVGLLRYVVAVVHDEVVLDVPAGEALTIAQEVAKVLEDRTFRIPLLAEATVYGESWGDGYT